MHESQTAFGQRVALVFATVLAATSGCATARPVPVVVDPTPRARVLVDESFTFIAGSADQTPVAAPVIPVSVADHSTAMIVDLGGGKAILTAALAALLGRPADPIAVAIGSQRGHTPWITAAIDPILDASGASGKIDPAWLLGRGYVVVDLARARLFLVDATPALLRGWLKARFGDLPFSEVPIHSVASGDAAAILVDASLEDSPALQARLDTTGARTTFPSAYAGIATRASTPPATTSEAAKEPTTVKKELTGRTLRFAGRAFGPVTILAASSTVAGAPPVQAVLGLDVLTGAVIVVPVDRKEPLLIAVP